MKKETLKKTLLYRTMAFILGIGITTAFIADPILNWTVTIISELASIFLYYIYEFFWRRMTKKDTGIFMMRGNNKVRLEYNVLKVLADNKFVIEVV